MKRIIILEKKNIKKANTILNQITKPENIYSPNDLVFYYDLIFKCLEKLGKFGQAHSCIERRNLLKSQQPENINYDKNIILLVIKNYKNYFTFKNSKQFKKILYLKIILTPLF